MKVIHIGLGKTATTSLQNAVFPRIAERGFAGSFNDEELVKLIKAFLHYQLPAEQIRKKIDDMVSPFVSSEVLAGWDPRTWEQNRDRNLEAFGSDSTILLTIRDPASYFRSLYQQKVQDGNVIKPSEFFLSAEEYEHIAEVVRVGELDAINVDGFDLRRLVDLYADSFAKVIVVSMTGIRTLQFFESIWAIKTDERLQLKNLLSTHSKQNRSYSNLAMKLTFSREKLLNSLGFKSYGTSDRVIQKRLNTEKMGDASADSSIFKQALRLSARALRATIGSVGWKHLMHLVSRLSPRPYKLPKHTNLGALFEENEEFYKEVESANGYVIYPIDAKN